MIIATIFLCGQHQHDKDLRKQQNEGAAKIKRAKKKLSMQIVDVGKEAKLW